MRPNKLLIQAFGPFAKKEEIDFTSLGDNPLFLINGPTGAGKSSILDAICFALYGQTTGKERDPSHMRCDHAAPDLLTEITLDFSLGEQHYRVRRAPTQERPKSRGEGTTPHQTEAQIWQLKPEGDQLLVPQKAQEATQTIEALTGLNVEQFRQVMVLPQGKFRDFLMADSSQREAIFSKLFQTQIYKRIEDTLKTKAASIRKEVENLQNQIKGILQGADLNTEAEVQEQLTALTPQLESATQHKNQTVEALAKAEKALEAGKILTKAFLALDTTQKALDNLNAKKVHIDAQKHLLTRAQTAQKIEHLKATLSKSILTQAQLDKDIKTTEQNLSQHQNALAQAQSVLDQAEKNNQSLDVLKEQLADLRKLEPKINQLAEAIKQSQTTQTALETASAAFENQQTQLKQLITRISASENRINTLKAASAVLPEKQRQLDGLLILGQQRANLDKRFEEQKALQQTRIIREEHLNTCRAKFDAQVNQVKQLEFTWHSSQAAILAAELKQGQPCPVCGSQEHPTPANTLGQASPVTKQGIEAARAIQTTLQQQLTSAQNDVTQTSTQQQNIEALIIEQQQELGENQHHPTHQLRADWRKLNDEVETFQLQQKEQTQLEMELQALTLQRSQLEQQIEVARLSLQKAQQEQTIAAQNQLHIQQALPEEYRVTGTLTHQIEQLDAQIKSITMTYDHALATFNANQEKVTQSQVISEQQQIQKKAIDQALAEAHKNWTTALSQSAFKDEDDFINAQKTESEQQQLLSEIEQYSHQLSGCKATLEQQQQQLDQQKTPNMEALEAEKSQLKATSAQSLESWKNIDNRHRQLTDVLIKLDQAHQSNHALESEYKVYGTLSDVANGQTGNKISLQRFVLSVLLDDVLIEASHRLNNMSKGRYLLIRKEERAKGNKASGLELEVEDAYTGKTRSVATLSGGESFMAALSLALGLSDVVQAYAGGIKLETLFIDEGFGSLDQESLDLAIKTLIDLQSSGRMIGIISHVSELRDQMALRIDVHSSASGSHIFVKGE
ncbi:AAA family ATPase [Alkalimarinus alittae]|uniref:SMC family ATPase n=1 Tax=Alkalimarinus alittae TaxID=2961619 RepID=A0ABY6MZY2_9ALTE|nr:SMC family ATPase [Alkalimarinus alittae]UZE95355.1 SMC family ATPase [Alkalimarinus alittae]